MNLKCAHSREIEDISVKESLLRTFVCEIQIKTTSDSSQIKRFSTIIVN